MPLEADTAILERVLEPLGTNLSSEAAGAILALDLPDQDRQRVQMLGDKSNAGSLSADEQRELENYLRVGNLLALLKSKARLSLASQDRAART